MTPDVIAAIVLGSLMVVYLLWLWIRDGGDDLDWQVEQALAVAEDRDERGRWTR